MAVNRMPFLVYLAHHTLFCIYYPYLSLVLLPGDYAGFHFD